MENDKKIDIKISTDQFEIKNLEIVNGRIEFVLSASITESSINESSLPENFSINTPVAPVADSATESTQFDNPVDAPRIMKVKSDDYQHELPTDNITDSSPEIEPETPVFEVPEDLPVYDAEENPPAPVTEGNTKQSVEDDVAIEPSESVDEKQRYGEPERDVEWQAVEVEDHVTLSEPPAPPTLHLQEEITKKDTKIQGDDIPDEELPEYLHEEPAEAPTESIGKVADNETENINAIPLATPDKNQELPSYLSSEHPQQPTPQQESESVHMSDSLPDYLQKSMPAENHKQTFPSYIKEHDSITPNSEVPQPKPEIDEPAPQPEQYTEDNNSFQPQPAPTTAPTPAPEEKQPELPEELPAPEVIKKVRFVCPKCKTPGSLPIDKIGSIISCNNCGRAMKLNIKK